MWHFIQQWVIALGMTDEFTVLGEDVMLGQLLRTLPSPQKAAF